MLRLFLPGGASFGFTLAVLLNVMFVACSKNDGSVPLSVRSSRGVVNVYDGSSHRVRLQVQGGIKPYKLALVSGKARLEGHEVVVSWNSDTVLLHVSDAIGNEAYTEIYVNNYIRPLTFKIDRKYLNVGQKSRIWVDGAVGKPSISVFSGNAKIEGDYVSSDVAGPVVLKVADDLGRTSYSSLPIVEPIEISLQSRRGIEKTHLYTNDSIRIVPRGGLPPYKFEILGTYWPDIRFDNEKGILVTGNSTGTIGINVSDDLGQRKRFLLYIRHQAGTLVDSFGKGGVLFLDDFPEYHLELLGHDEENDDLYRVMTLAGLDKPNRIRIFRHSVTGESKPFSRTKNFIELVQHPEQVGIHPIQMAVAKNKKLLLLTLELGETWKSSHYRIHRFNEDGSRDLSLNEEGSVDLTGFSTTGPLEFILDDDHSFIVVGQQNDPQKKLEKVMVAHYSSLGALDADFGRSGNLTTPIEVERGVLGVHEHFTEVQETRSGKRYVIAGKYWNGEESPPYTDQRKYQVGLFAFDESGKPVQDFGKNGLVTLNIKHRPLVRLEQHETPKGLSQYAFHIHSLSDNGLLVTGNVWKTPYAMLLSPSGTLRDLKLFSKHQGKTYYLKPTRLADGSFLIRGVGVGPIDWLHLELSGRRLEFSDSFENLAKLIVHRDTEEGGPVLWEKFIDSDVSPLVLGSGELVFGGATLTQVTGRLRPRGDIEE